MKQVIALSLLLLSAPFAYCMKNSQQEDLEGVSYRVERKRTESDYFFHETQITAFNQKVWKKDKEHKKFLMAFVKAQNSSVIETTTNNVFNSETNDYRVLEALFIHFNNQEVYVTRRVDPSDIIFYETCVKKVCEWNFPNKLIVPQFGKWVNSYGYDQDVKPYDVELTVITTPIYK